MRLKPSPLPAPLRPCSAEINAPAELKMKLLAVYLANDIEIGSRRPVYAYFEPRPILSLLSSALLHLCAVTRCRVRVLRSRENALL